MATTEMLDARTREIETELETLISRAETFKRSFSPAEITRQNELLDDLKSVAAKRRAAEDEDLIRRSVGAEFGKIKPQFHTGETSVYQQNGEQSYFRDMFNARSGDSGARERLDRHSKAFNAYASTHQELRAINTTAGTGGEFAPPLWLIDNYIAALRPARATADILTKLELPGGTDIVNIPKIATGTTTATQGTQNSAISQTDITTTTVPATVYTIAGGQVFSMQLFEQSPMAGTMDRVILGDLMADYAKQLGSQVISGTGTGQPFGLLNAAGSSTITYTDAAPAFMGVGKLYAKIGQAVQTVQTSRFLSPTAIVMHPRRWAWAATQVDTAGRAVILPDDQGPLNASGTFDPLNAQGPVGRMFGLPVITDPSIPTNLGAGTNQDTIIVLRAEDSWLYESTIKAEVFAETYSNQLSLYARVYNYYALAHRLGQSICTIGGTGLITPTF